MTFFATVGTIIFAFGIAIGILGLVMVGYGVLAPVLTPTHSAPLHHEGEGHPLAFVFGIFVAFIGPAGVAVGRAIESAVTRPVPPAATADPAVAAAERPRDTLDRG